MLNFPPWRPGDLITVVVGVPGPDTDLAIVTKIDGEVIHYKMRVYGQGPWFEGSWRFDPLDRYGPATANPARYPYAAEYQAEAARIKLANHGCAET